MKFEDETQNLKMRMVVIHGLVIAILVVLGVRLYFLQVVRGEYYAERAENQRIRRLRIPAPRGAIFDRHGKLLVDSRSTYNILLAGEDMKGKDWNVLIAPLSDGLGLDPGLLRERFDEASRQPAFEEMTIKEGATPADIAWVEAHTLELPMLLVREQPQRRYPDGGTLAHVLGYVGEISPEQLKQPRFKDPAVNPFVKDNPYRPGDIIGQEGLESTYDRYLRGRDGYREVEVDSRGRIQRELSVVQPQPGQDIVTTIDLEMQLTAEEQLRNSPNKRGVIVVMDPQNGEIMAMASLPDLRPEPLLAAHRHARGAARGERPAARPHDPDVQPRHPRPLPARLDVEDSDGGGRPPTGRHHDEELEPRLRRRHPDRQQVHALHGTPREPAAAHGHQALVRRLLLPPRPQDGARRHHGDGGRVRPQQEDGR